MLKFLCLGLATALGLAATANGFFMLVAPQAWYFAIPGVTTTGPFNPHFVRDIGLIFLLIAAAFLGGAARPAARAVLWGAATVWLTGHALFHLWEVATGICSPSAIARDFPAVSLPALIGWGLTAWSLRRAPASPESAGGPRLATLKTSPKYEPR